MIPAHVRIFVCTLAVDMRYGFDRLAQMVRELLGQDPQNGSLFVFANRRGTHLQVLWFDKNGYCMLYKRLHQALFRVPPGDGDSVGVRIDATALARLLAGEPKKASRRRMKPK